MSSPENGSAPAPKKRKLQRACDYCKSKKSDGSDMPNNRCSKCVARRIECTYLLGQNSYPRSYVEDLESRLERMERLMNKFLPDKELAKGLDDYQSDKDPANAPSTASRQLHASGSRIGTTRTPSALVVAPPTPHSSANTPQDTPREEDEDEEAGLDKELAEGVRKLSMHSPPLRYHGKSSGLALIQSAIAQKNAYAGVFRPPPKRDGQHPWLKGFVENEFPMLEERSFPPRDLLDALVDLYFAHTNSEFPLLHGPTFRKLIAAGEHLHNGGFGATVLLACAIGARFTRDPRVLLDDSDHHHSAGWKWFLVVVEVRRIPFAPAKVYDLQIHALMALFLQGTTVPQSAWSMIGAGVRMALDVGAHRKTMYSQTPTVEGELWRRAFWLLVLLEWMISYGLGRPCSIQDEDCDLALPTECDDEYWLTPEGEPLFKQPPGKPSRVTTFVCMLRLAQILAFAMRTIYSTNKSRVQLGHSDQQWEQRIVADLDSALNRWADSLPSHLRWDPEQTNEDFLAQAASLRAYHYYTQFAVHRKFTSSAHRESPPSFPSVIICTNGARWSIQALEIVYRRTGSPGHRNFGILFLAGVILMTNIFGLKRSGRTVSMGKDLGLVRNAIGMLGSLRYEVHVAESLGELLNDLLSAVTDPHPPEAGVPARREGLSTVSMEPNPEGSMPEKHTAYPSIIRKPTPSDSNNSSAGPSSASATSTLPDAITNVAPGLDFMPSGIPRFTLPLGVGGLESFAGSLTPTGAANQTSQPPSALLQEYNFLPPLRGPLAPSPSTTGGSSQASTSQAVQGQAQFGMGAGQMFGLEPLRYNTSMSFLSSTPIFEPQAGTSGLGSAQQPEHDALAGTAPTLGSGDQPDAGMPDLALTADDALVLWSNLPVGWEKWGTYLADGSNSGT